MAMVLVVKVRNPVVDSLSTSAYYSLRKRICRLMRLDKRDTFLLGVTSGWLR